MPPVHPPVRQEAGHCQGTAGTEGVLRRTVQARDPLSWFPRAPEAQKGPGAASPQAHKAAAEPRQRPRSPLPGHRCSPALGAAQPSLVTQTPSSLPPPKTSCSKDRLWVPCHWEQPTSSPGEAIYTQGTGGSSCLALSPQPYTGPWPPGAATTPPALPVPR